MIAHQYLIRQQKSKTESLDFNIQDVILKNSEVVQIDGTTAKNFIVEYEWLGTMPMFCRYFFGLYFNIGDKRVLGGVVVYSDEYSANKSTIWDKYEFTDKLILLSRGVCSWWTPKNTASYFITKTIDFIRKNTNYKIITATVDPMAGEIGTIYQSLNWHYVGLMTGNYNKSGSEMKRFSVLINGKLKHSRSMRKEFGTIRQDVILAKYPDAIFIPQYRKRRYFYFIGNKTENKKLCLNISHLVQPYPKRDEASICGLIYQITNKINNKIYIGQTTRMFSARIDEYRRGVGCNDYLKSSFKKYGFENFDFKIIDNGTSIDELNQKEIDYISKYNTTNKTIGYNIESGGRNSLVSDETRIKLSDKKRGHVQTRDWIDKRTDQISKKVIKVNLLTNVILEEYKSLANAAENNKDDLTYSALNRKCLFDCYNDKDSFWCYYDDYINNTIKEYNPEKRLDFSTLDQECLIKIKDKYKNGQSIRDLSDEFNIYYSTLNKYLTTVEKSIDNREYILKCNKTDKTFTDIINKSGCLTRHIIETYKIELPSTFKRKQIELKTGNYWFDQYFTKIYK